MGICYGRHARAGQMADGATLKGRKFRRQGSEKGQQYWFPEKLWNCESLPLYIPFPLFLLLTHRGKDVAYAGPSAESPEHRFQCITRTSSHITRRQIQPHSAQEVKDQMSHRTYVKCIIMIRRASILILTKHPKLNVIPKINTVRLNYLSETSAQVIRGSVITCLYYK